MVSLVAACGPFHQTLPFSFHQNNLDIDWHKGMAFYDMKYRWGICFYRKLWILCVCVCVCLLFHIGNILKFIGRLIHSRDPELEPAGGTDDDEKKPEKSNRQPQPRRRFQWSKEIRFIRHSPLESFKLRTFANFFFFCLQSNIKSSSLPKGWMLQLV